MSKAKLPKGEANKTLRARTDFLFRASKHIHESSIRDVEIQQPKEAATDNPELAATEAQADPLRVPRATQRYLAAHMRAAARKSQIRLPQNVKRSFCKRCDACLDGDVASQSHIENKSRHGSKPWAAVKVITCVSCHATKRFPLGVIRQLKKKKRKVVSKANQNSTPRDAQDFGQRSVSAWPTPAGG